MSSSSSKTPPRANAYKELANLIGSLDMDISPLPPLRSDEPDNLNNDELELEKAISAYEKGMQLKKICEQRLKEAKLRIENIKDENETN